MDVKIGKVIKGLGGLYDVRYTDGSDVKIVSCRARKNIKRTDDKVLIGDNVELSFDKDGSVIEKILDRKNSLIRPPIANLDYLFITFSVSNPMPVLSTVDKMTAIARHNNITPIIIITKSDCSSEYAKYEDVYLKSGFEVFVCSSENGQGIDRINNYINVHLKNGVTGAFSGASGVGKSTLMNMLFPNLNLDTGEISSKIMRGKHTTRHVELYEIGTGKDAGFLADTPGFGFLDFEHFDFFGVEELLTSFCDLEKHSHLCRYADCTHTKEEECGIAEAVNNGLIPSSRLESYRELYKVLKSKKNYK